MAAGSSGPAVRLKPAVRRLWRRPGSMQFGLSSRRGAVLDGLTPADESVIDALRAGVDRRSVGASDGRCRRLVGLLSDAGLLVDRHADRAQLAALGENAIQRLDPDAAVWSIVRPSGGDGWPVIGARSRVHVAVHGTGRLGATLAATLAAAGIGRVSCRDDRPVTQADVAPAGARACDVGTPRGRAAELAVLRAGGNSRAGAAAGPAPPSRPDLVVLVDAGAAGADRADPLLRAEVPHLSVVVRDDDVVVGPLVRAGRGPCLRCLDLHRTDRDPAWPTVLAQIRGPGAAAHDGEETAVSTLAAGLAALQVLAVVDGVPEPAAAGATLEIELPDGLVGRREWPVHHRCGCTWPGGRSGGYRDGPGPGSGGRGRERPARMGP